MGGYWHCAAFSFLLELHRSYCYLLGARTRLLFFGTILFNHVMPVHFPLVEILGNNFIKRKKTLHYFCHLVCLLAPSEGGSLWNWIHSKGGIFAQWSIKCVLGYLEERSLCQGFHFINCTLSRHFLEGLCNEFGQRLLWLPTLSKKQALEGTVKG